jgi:hypothetical protein
VQFSIDTPPPVSILIAWLVPPVMKQLRTVIPVASTRTAALPFCQKEWTKTLETSPLSAGGLEAKKIPSPASWIALISSHSIRVYSS